MISTSTLKLKDENASFDYSASGFHSLPCFSHPLCCFICIQMQEINCLKVKGSLLEPTQCFLKLPNKVKSQALKKKWKVTLLNLVSLIIAQAFPELLSCAASIGSSCACTLPFNLLWVQIRTLFQDISCFKFLPVSSWVGLSEYLWPAPVQIQMFLSCTCQF
jgi:hypothetical protein